MELGAGKGRNLSFQQVLEAPVHDPRYQGAGADALYELAKIGGLTMREGQTLRSDWR